MALLTKLAWNAIQKAWHLGIGAISPPDAPPSATLGRFDFKSDESDNAAVSAKKGVCAIQRNGVEIQSGGPSAKRSAPQVDITS